ncbi:DUF4837 family protein [Aquiflexum sp. TKW24L]|uniref:DUF4837 family protein n=1 Tax=Aquiflexum sp. TKW24L TaxID=2942212 RepID=UPI0020BF8EE2|nr:DUF4837 family protein [Aquiflexum sp. TKW24L]MCL6260324.1 DUF4837 family protein [Aquiflexum sp. TKW24L]
MIFIIGMMAFWSCEQGEGSSSTKPKARGAIGEIVLAIDSAKWDGPVGEALREVFESDVPGLIRGERMFDIRKIDPSAMSRIFKISTNIIFVTTFDDKKIGSQNINAIFTKEAKQKAASDPSLYLLRSEDEFAKGQEVIYLFGNNESQLVENLLKNKNKLQNLFQVRERERMEKVLMSRKSSEARVASEKLGLAINTPASYQIVKSEDDFLWLRQPTPTTDRPDISLFFYATDYTSEEQVFPDSLMGLRDKIAKKHIFGDPRNPNSYLTIERVDPTPLFKNFLIKDNYGVEIRGGWKTNNLSMGGSFLAYVIVDSKNGKLYYMEGFVYYPNEAHREAIREIETILLATDLLGEKEKAS